MKMKGLLLCLFLMVPFSAFGDEKADLARELMELTEMRRMMEQVETQIREMQNKMMVQFEIPADQTERTEAFRKKVNDRIFEILGYKNMEQEYLDLFTSVYTVEELRGITNFYKSPIGKSMIQKQPLVVNKAMEITRKKVDVLLPELQKMTEEFKKEEAQP